MSFDQALTQTMEMLRRNGRVSYRALKREFGIDDGFVADLRDELVEVLKIATDEGGTMLVLARSEATVPTPSDPVERPPEGERRHIAVMFCDLVGSTSLASRIDPEELGDVYSGWQDICAASAAAFGGHVAEYLGDGALIYFGYPIAHEDSAERAVQAALAIQADLGRLGAEQARGAVGIAARIGIHHGLVLLSDLGGRYAKKQFAVGASPNIAARLQSLAGPGEIVVSDTMHPVLRGRFACEPMGLQTLKGVPQQIATYRITGQAGLREPGAVPSRGATLVGRAAELAILDERLGRAEAGSGQTVLLTGEPGMGKTRIVEEISRMAMQRGMRRIVLHCSSLHSAGVLHPVVDNLRSRLDAEGGGDEVGKLATLSRILSALPAERIVEAVALIAPLLALAPYGASVPVHAANPAQVRLRVFDLLCEWAVRIAEPSGLLLVVESVHWADPSTQSLVEMMAARIRSTRILLMVTARPETATVAAYGPAFDRLDLPRLSRDEAEALIRRAAGDKTLPSPVARTLVARGDGVPMFLEELVAAILASGFLVEREGSYELVGDFAELPIPDTLQASLTARLERAGESRETAQWAAALGRTFPRDLLARLAFVDEATLSRHIERLLTAGILQRDAGPSATSYGFRHALIQEAAYESMLRSRRRVIHRRIAAVLAEGFGQLIDLQPEFVAHHFTEAGLSEDAVRMWRKAGDDALRRSAGTEALRSYDRARSLLRALPATPARLTGEVAVEVGRGSALLLTRGQANEQVGDAFRHALLLASSTRDSADLLPVYFGLWRFLLGRSELGDALHVAKRFLALAERFEPSLRLAGNMSVGLTLYNCGRVQEGFPYLELAISQGAEDASGADRRSATYMIGQDPLMICLLCRALSHWLCGREAQALADASAASDLAEALGLPYNKAVAGAWITLLHYLRRDAAATLDWSARAHAVCEAHGFTMWASACAALAGAGRAMAGDVAGGLAAIRKGAAAFEATGSNLLRTRNLALIAEACSAGGMTEEGLAAIRSARAGLNLYGERWAASDLDRIEAELLLRLGNRAEAETCLRSAIELAERDGLEALVARARFGLERCGLASA